MLNWSDVLQQYKIKLSNLSQRNRNLKTGKLSRGKLTDFFPFGFLGKQTLLDLLDKIISEKSISLISKINARYPNIAALDKELTLLYRETNKIYEETGSNELYLAVGFTFGKFIDGTEVNAPLLLIPVRLVRNRIKIPRWELVPEESDSYYNYLFLLAYQKFNKHPIFKEALDNAPKPPFGSFKEMLTKYYEHLEALHVDIKIPSAYLFGLFNPYNFPTKEDFEKVSPGELEVKPYVVLGIFPQTQKGLSEDYDDLSEMLEKNPNVIEEWLEGLTRSLPEKKESPFYPFLFDESQRKILEHIHAEGSAIVHGPPGTGKSQLLLNVICDALARNKKVLVISQKKAALNVLYQRMKQAGLQELAFLVHDYKSDKQRFYQKLKKSVENIQTNSWDTPEEIAPLFSLERHLAEKLQKPFEKLQEKLPCELTPHEIYIRLNYSEKENPFYIARNIASLFTYKEIRELKLKFQEVLLYKHLFDKTHPWISRYPLHEKSEQDRREIAEFLEERLPEILRRLGEIRRTLPEVFQEDFKKELFRKIDLTERVLEIPNLEKVLAEDLEQLKRQTEFLEKKYYGVRMINSVNPENPAEWKPIAETLNTLQTLNDSFFKIFKPVYHKSRNYLKKVAESRKVPQTTLEYEVLSLREFEKLLSEYRGKPLFQDIPREFPVGNLEEYIEHKWYLLDLLEQFFKEFGKTRTNVEEIRNLLQTLRQKKALQEEHDALMRELEEVFTEVQIQTLFEKYRQGKTEKEISEEYLRSWLSDFSEMRELDALVYAMDEKTRKLLYSSLHLMKDNPDWFEDLKQAFLFAWISEAEREFPELRFYSSKSYKEITTEYLQVQDDKSQALIPVLVSLWKQRVADVLKLSDKTGDFLYQIKKQRRLWSLRKLFNVFHELVSVSVPCLLTSPETAASVLPMKIGDFDLVLMDEASQCPVEEAFPVLLRGKRLLVTGDEKQLPPLNLFKVSAETILDEEDYRLEHLAESESALDFALKYLPEFYLEWHYRSLFRELIEFSNYAFYEGKLKTLPLRVPDERFQPPLQYIKLENGLWEENKNVAEGLKIIELIKEFLAWENPPTLGVITFNIQQQELILDFLDKYLDSLSEEEIERIAPLIFGQGERPPLFVKNIENVQGDERDVILFSVGYAKDKQGKLRHHFGLLNLEGGERRLNVAITRAKKQIYLVTSILPEDLKTEGIKHSGPKLLKKYLFYAKKISERISLSEDFLRALFPETDFERSEFASEENLFYRRVKEHFSGYEENLGSKDFHLDFANFETGEAYVLEGKQFFGLRKPATRHYHILKYLHKLGWNLEYLHSRNYAKGLNVFEDKKE